MNKTTKQSIQSISEFLYENMNTDHKDSLNLENIRKLYELIPEEYQDSVRDKLRKFVIDNQKFVITKEEFLQLFPKNPTPCIHINLSIIQDKQRIQELSHDELRNVISKRMEYKVDSGYKAKFININNLSIFGWLNDVCFGIASFA